MINQVVFVGRLTAEPEIKELESNKKVCNATIAVARNFKNQEGTYDTDFIPVTIWEAMADSITTYCHKGDLVGIKGRLQTYDNKLEVVAEKITFLSSKKEDKE